MAKKKQILFLFAARPRFSSKIMKDHIGTIKEVDIFPNLDTMAQLDRRRTHGGKGKSNALGAQGPGL
jgi:hypothetical protein